MLRPVLRAVNQIQGSAGFGTERFSAAASPLPPMLLIRRPAGGCAGAIRAYTLIPMPDITVAATPACYCLAARKHARAITRFYEERLRPHGLRATQFSALAVLALKGDTPVSTLARILDADRTTVTRVVAVLERRGWIATAGSDDARERRLRITPAGRRKLERALPAWAEAQDLVERGLAGLPEPRRPGDTNAGKHASGGKERSGG
jgi:DNA-binding MarR family transcriptional regulator